MSSLICSKLFICQYSHSMSSLYIHPFRLPGHVESGHVEVFTIVIITALDICKSNKRPNVLLVDCIWVYLPHYQSYCIICQLLTCGNVLKLLLTTPMIQPLPLNKWTITLLLTLHWSY